MANPYDPCVLNKLGSVGVQITMAVHVDDLLVSSASNDNLASFERYLQIVFRKHHNGKLRAGHPIRMWGDCTESQTCSRDSF